MRRLALAIVVLAAASPAAAQTPNVLLPSETACNVLRERVQLALVRADQALQADNTDDAARWSAIGAHYATIFAAFCGNDDPG